MMAKCNVYPSKIENIFHSVTLVPRLNYAVGLLDEIIDVLVSKHDELRAANEILASDFDESEGTGTDALRLEYLTVLSLDTLLQIKKSMGQISGLSSISEVLPPLIPLTRTVSAQLFDIHPGSSKRLSEISVHLGSIVLDSAVLSTARFDFSRFNAESSAMLDKVKLMVGSKLNKQYPNLDFLKLYNT